MNLADKSADAQSMEKDVVINGKSQSVDEELAALESECEPQCSVVENASPEAAQTESLSDWFVMICVLLSNLLTGMNYASYGVLYVPITEMFQSSRAAVGLIVSFEFALASLLGELHSFLIVTVVFVLGGWRPGNWWDL